MTDSRQSDELEARKDAWEWWGESDADVLIAGHSHRNAYRSALIDGLIKPDLRVRLLERRRGSELPPAPDGYYWRSASGAQGKALLLVWSGNQHNQHFLFESSVPLRPFNAPAGDGPIVPSSMISALWAETLEGLSSVVESSKAEEVLLLGTPPPKPDAAIRSGLAREPNFVREIEAAGATVDGIPLTPGPTRVALWSILQADLEKAGKRAGARFVSVPADLRTSQGYLKPEFSASDASHANAAFAVAMLDEARKYMRTSIP